MSQQKLGESASFDSHHTYDTANFPLPQQHPFALGVRLSALFFYVEVARIIIAGISLRTPLRGTSVQVNLATRGRVQNSLDFV